MIGPIEKAETEHLDGSLLLGYGNGPAAIPAFDANAPDVLEQTVAGQSGEEDLTPRETVSLDEKSSDEAALPAVPTETPIDFAEAVRIAASIRSALQPITESLVGYSPIVSQGLLALITGEHQLLFSRAGTAKSLYASKLFSTIESSTTFKIKLTKGTTEEALVGSVDIQALKEGRIQHRIEGSIIEADFAFLDEFFDANDVCLRALLDILNERKFSKGQQQETCKLGSAIATTNYVRSTQVTEAVTDRFLFRATLMPERDPIGLLDIDESVLMQKGNEKREAISLTDLHKLRSFIEYSQSVNVPPHVMLLKNIIAMKTEEYLGQIPEESRFCEPYISPRTLVKAQKILRAAALLDGREEAMIADLSALRDVFITIGQPEQEAAFEKALKESIHAFPSTECKMFDALWNVKRMLTGVSVAESRKTKPDVHWWLKILDSLARWLCADINMPESGTLLDSKRLLRVINSLNPLLDITKNLKDEVLRLIEERERIK